MDTDASTASEGPSRRLFLMSIGVFFIGGFLAALVSLLVPRFRSLFGFDYAEALAIQFASHSSYLLFALPIAGVVVRVGYLRAIATGLAVMAAGCLALVAADAAGTFLAVLAALLLLSLGVSFLQIAANAVIAASGSARNAASRLTLLQGFNSLGTVAGPLLAAPYLLDAARPSAAEPPFLAAAALLVVLAALFTAQRDLLPGRIGPGRGTYDGLAALLRDPPMRAGNAAMFAYVGAEVTIGALLVNYLARPQAFDVGLVAAGRLVSLYWGGAMVGRFAGAALLTRVAPARVLGIAAAGAALLTFAAVVLPGSAGGTALLAVGLCNSVMYPTLYTLALPADAARVPLGSMLLCMAVVGGAVVPMLGGVVADGFGLEVSLLLPAACYLGILLYARYRGA